LSPAFGVVVELGIDDSVELWVIFDVNVCVSITIPDTVVQYGGLGTG